MIKYIKSESSIVVNLWAIINDVLFFIRLDIDSCTSNSYQDWCADADGDTLGGELTNDDLCTDFIGDDGSVNNCDDHDDACTSNQ